MIEIEENTKLFYKELNGSCNVKKLLEIAEKCFMLYEPLFEYDNIKNNEYVVDISLLGNQYFVINTIEQYNRFKYLIKLPFSNLKINFIYDSTYFKIIILL
ncbi:hypothetical protein BCR32DRAFT_298833 [Anaeromyces robustus]|uniref:Uncharacterized protein n=1 Tax=Anaeromyces robustus TaxID=1754192 RepID=A0A1Y1XR42_9FUNG|nr:hypothetical protein BCR32DRAFT_298833 [Anaeromyces robustus]|eukprot:ORX88239.1 hypothetical protein BCR32DRAFT_298833 [Anaeromyces robustus]